MRYSTALDAKQEAARKSELAYACSVALQIVWELFSEGRRCLSTCIPPKNASSSVMFPAAWMSLGLPVPALRAGSGERFNLLEYATHAMKTVAGLKMIGTAQD